MEVGFSLIPYLVACTSCKDRNMRYRFLARKPKLGDLNAEPEEEEEEEEIPDSRKSFHAFEKKLYYFVVILAVFVKNLKS